MLYVYIQKIGAIIPLKMIVCKRYRHRIKGGEVIFTFNV